MQTKKKIAIGLAVGIVALLAVSFAYVAGAFTPVTKAIDQTVKYLNHEGIEHQRSTDRNSIMLHEKSAKSDEIYYHKSGDTPAAVKGKNAASSTVNASLPGQFTILDNRQFQLEPHEVKIFDFAVISPEYPITFSGDMQTSGTNSVVNFSLIEAERQSIIARMSAGYGGTGIQKAVNSDMIKKFRFDTQTGVQVAYLDIGPNSRDEPSFLAIFENTGDHSQTVTASLQLSYPAGAG